MSGRALFILSWGLLLICPRLALCAQEADRTTIAIEALSRLKEIDLESNPAVKAAVLKVLDQVRGKPQFVELVRDFRINGQNTALLDFAVANPSDTVGVEAIRLVLESHDTNLLGAVLRGTNTTTAAKTVEALGNTGDRRIVPLLEPLLTDPRRDVAVRKQALRALARVQEGAAALVRLVKENQLPTDLNLTAATELSQVRWDEIKNAAAAILPPPRTQSSEPLPPVSDLLKRTGDPARGATVYRRDTVGCINCHQVNGEGVDFGPNLSEIGAKLGKDALYESILDPSTGISFGYEAWQIEMKNGDEAFGLIVSETADEAAVKAQTGVVTRLKKSDIQKRTQQRLSIMPAGLQQAMSTQDLVDLVEYLSTLKKSGK